MTPLDAAHLSALDAGVVGAVDVDNVAAAASAVVQNKLLVGDAQPAFRVFGNGNLSWGPGGATAPDTTLYRSAAGVLKTDGQIVALGAVAASNGVAAQAVSIGSASMVLGADTNLYRSAAAKLKTDGQFHSTSYIAAFTGTANETSLGPARVDFAQGDTNLYRSAASHLKTDGFIHAGLNIVAFDGNATSQAAIGNYGPGGQGALNLGTAGDTLLYRIAAGQLQTDGYFIAKSDVVARDGVAAKVRVGDLTGGGVSGISFGAAGGDTQLFRASAANLETNGSFWTGATGALIAGSGTVYLGRGLDTSLYRSAAGTLKNDGVFEAAMFTARPGGAGQVRVGSNTADARMDFGSASDTNLYRVAAGQLRTDGILFTGQAIYANRATAQEVSLVSYQGAFPAVAFANTQDVLLLRYGAQDFKIVGGTYGHMLSINPPAADYDTSLGIWFRRAAAQGGGELARRVVVGNPDSGGSGYRLLAIAN